MESNGGSNENRGSPASADAFEGGDPVCWLHLVCASCGALLEHEDDPHRPGCDAGTVGS